MNIITRKEAQEAGLTDYFTGKPCKHGHVSERKVSNSGCCQCIKDRTKTYNDKHKEYRDSYYQQNKERIKERVRAYANEHKEEISKRTKQYRQDNLERLREYDRERYQRDKEKRKANSKRWRENNPHKHNANNAKRRAARYQQTPAWSDEQLIEGFYLLARAKTETTTVPHAVDHIIPLQGELVCGLHCEYNLQVITQSENSSKSNKFDVD